MKKSSPKCRNKDELIDIILENQNEIKRLQKEKEKIERELHKYKNSNIPSSANKHLKFNTLGQKKGGKRGTPKGYSQRT